MTRELLKDGEYVVPARRTRTFVVSDVSTSVSAFSVFAWFMLISVSSTSENFVLRTTSGFGRGKVLIKPSPELLLTKPDPETLSSVGDLLAPPR